jgi:hypothetical protein
MLAKLSSDSNLHPNCDKLITCEWAMGKNSRRHIWVMFGACGGGAVPNPL